MRRAFLRASGQTTANEYLLGHADPELERLQLQARCLERLTRRLIKECGIKREMRVLDLGSGAGDVAMLVAEAVGPSGRVLVVDAAPRAVDTARRRAADVGLRHVEFVVGDDEQISNHALFDAAIGRCVLIHQPDLAATVRRTAAAVRPGGIVAFMEPATDVSGHSTPEVPLVRAAGESLDEVLSGRPAKP